TFRGLTVLSKQISADKESLTEAERVIALIRGTNAILFGVSILIDNSKKHTALKTLRINIQSETDKLTLAKKILATTQTHKMASEACERLSRSNHIQGLLVPLQAGIAKASGDKKRYAEMVEKLAGAEWGKRELIKFSEGVKLSWKLRALAREIVALEAERGRAETVLMNTAAVEQIPGIITRFTENSKLLHSMENLERWIEFENSEMYDAGQRIIELDGKLKTARAEYRDLLLKAGICEGCKVVDAVMAAAG
ncbi:MAG TPA: hypothetical protein VEC37_02690, partial [Bacillota bacterium]|nr:hypothetical protein [Bacillota bacterium]